MKTIMNSLTFFTALGMSGLAHAHVGTGADESLLHKTLHFAEIGTVLFLVYLGFRLWRGFAKGK
tara:strand:- start:433 stop:624 length:192 start_codon:yes stop_codon:yes gene_type:complete